MLSKIVLVMESELAVVYKMSPIRVKNIKFICNTILCGTYPSYDIKQYDIEIRTWILESAVSEHTT